MANYHEDILREFLKLRDEMREAINNYNKAKINGSKPLIKRCDKILKTIQDRLNKLAHRVDYDFEGLDKSISLYEMNGDVWDKEEMVQAARQQILKGGSPSFKHLDYVTPYSEPRVTIYPKYLELAIFEMRNYVNAIKSYYQAQEKEKSDQATLYLFLINNIRTGRCSSFQGKQQEECYKALDKFEQYCKECPEIDEESLRNIFEIVEPRNKTRY
jgi:hypothetical protein